MMILHLKKDYFESIFIAFEKRMIFKDIFIYSIEERIILNASLLFLKIGQFLFFIKE
jgi:hypothetical protein